MSPTPGFHTYTRSPDGALEAPYEKPVIVPSETDRDPAHHAWADARFATDIMSEHAEFFALLMPPELMPAQRQQAVEFAAQFAELHRRIDAGGPPDPNDVASFCGQVVEAVKPFIDYKATLGAAQREGTFR